MKTTKEIILSLIKDDLTNLTLIKGLRNLGIDATNYDLNIPDAIIKLMNDTLTEEENEKVHQHYCDFANRIIDFNLSNISLEQQAEEVYEEVINWMGVFLG